MTNWILLRGLARESAHWGDFPDHLMRALPDTRLHCVDLPGNGLEHARRSPWSVQGMARHCMAERERLIGSEPAYLLAMSLGAMVAVQWAAEAPQEVAGCVLVNTSLRPFNPFYRRLRPAAWPSVARLLLPGASALQIESTVLRLTSRQSGQHARQLERWLGIRSERPVSAGNALRQLIAAARFAAPAHAPSVPVLMLASRHDGLVDSQCSAAIARQWNCAIEWHPDAGHDLPLDDPVWVATAVRRWMAQAGVSSEPR